MCRRRLILSLVALIGAGVALSGCAGSSGAPGASSSSSAAAETAVGEWRSEAAQPASLVIEADGTVTGTDGCNRLSGSAELGGAEIRFAPGAMTLMACPGVTVSFQGLATGRIDGDVLTTYDDAGTEIVRLQRVAP